MYAVQNGPCQVTSFHDAPVKCSDPSYSVIQHVLGELEDKVKVLDDRIAELGSRISPVLTPPLPQAACEMKGECHQMIGSPIREVVLNLIRRVDILAVIVTEMTSRAEC